MPRLLIPFLLLLLFPASFSDPCVPLQRTVTLPLPIHLLFVGPPPIFMRPNLSPSLKSAFISKLSTIIRHPAPPAPHDTSPMSLHVSKPRQTLCSVIQYNHTYSISFADPSVVRILDHILSEELEKAGSMFANGPAVANRFAKAVKPLLPDHNNLYTLMLYQAAALAPQRGYTAEKGSKVTTIAMAVEKRFAFLDVGAKPYFLDQGGSTPGELLTVSSREVSMYAQRLRDIAISIFSPTPSSNLRRFPKETRVVFELREVDVSAVIGRLKGVAGDSTDEVGMGKTFDKAKFETMVKLVFGDGGFGGKQLNVQIVKANVGGTGDANVSMAVARAFSMKGLEMVLDSARLLRDVVGTGGWGGYFVDRSFMAHVPMYLFSIADDSRVLHFETGEEIRAKVIEQQAIFMVENRLKDRVDDLHTSVTSEAVKEVFELLCGLGKGVLAYMDATKGVVPVVLQDLMKANILAQELDWSESMAARKAVELLDFEGLDSRLIPHEQGSAIAEGRIAVAAGLETLYEAWDKAAIDGNGQHVEDVTFELIRKSKYLADKLHDEICNQHLREEILLKADAEVDKGNAVRPAVRSIWFYLTCIYFPFAAGILCAGFVHTRRQQRKKARGNTLGEIPIVSPRHQFEPPASGLWFSTLTSSDKPKVH